MKNKIFFLLIYLVLILSHQAQSGTMWKWRDENNVIHYSDSKKSVPAQFQSAAEEISVAGSSISTKVETATTPPVTEKINKEKSDNSEVIKELASQLYGEITRDRNILTYVGNQISLALTRDSLEKDLIKKGEILKKFETDKVENPQVKTWLTKNISQEQAIVETLKGHVTEDKFVFALRSAQENIENNLKDKERILATLTQK